MVLPTAYLAPVSYYAAMFHCQNVIIETQEHYIKQTIRNRAIISTGQGPQTLSVNVAKGNRPHTPVAAIRLSNHANWMHQHLYSLATYYGNTPFYEYYIDELKALFPSVDQEELPTLFSFNESLRCKICELIGFEPQVSYTNQWAGPTDYEQGLLSDDGRLSFGQHGIFCPKGYYQVAAVEGKLGFMKDMSIVDLLFNMGPESIIVLRDSWNKN